MKAIALSLLITCIVAGNIFAQQVTKVVINNKTYYLTREIGEPIIGTYKYGSKSGEPIVKLNADGSGLFQLHGAQPTKMIWGIESDAQGKPKKMDGVIGGIYNLWYQIKEKHKGKDWESGVVDSWNLVELSISIGSKKIYIEGERIKDF